MFELEHDGCEGCIYSHKSEKEEPCVNCKENHVLPNDYTDFYEQELDNNSIITRKNIIVNICGVPHTIIEKEDVFNADGIHFGQIDYKKCEILVADDLSEDAKAETICHEMLHGMLVHLGYDELSQDEKFVQALGNAIYNSFYIKGV